MATSFDGSGEAFTAAIASRSEQSFGAGVQPPACVTSGCESTSNVAAPAAGGPTAIKVKSAPISAPSRFPIANPTIRFA